MATASCDCETSMNIAQRPMYIPHRLHALLSTVKKINLISTLEEVLWAMKDYIYKHTLYDLTDPRIIHCEKNELGKVLGVRTFTLLELKRILLRLILKENVETVQDLQKTLQATNSKRKADEIPPADCVKKLRFENISVLPSAVIAKMKLTPQLLNIKRCKSDLETSIEDAVILQESSGDDEEEVGHFFAEENILAIKHMYNVEYEIETETSSDSDASVTDTESDVEESFQATFLSTNSKLSDEEFWADQSSEEYHSDVEMTESDCWLCSECGVMNKPPIRYCLKCWEERKGWVADHSDKRIPPRPQRRKVNKSNNERIDNLKNDSIAVDSVQPSSSKAFLSPLSSSHTYLSSQYNSSQNTNLKDTKTCILCCSKPMNATVVHGKIGHQFSCYKCARKLLSLNKSCPICRRPIDRVIHQIVFE